VTSILLTNDDGIQAEGLITLEKALSGLAHVVVVAPDHERSAVSHGLTLRSPLNLEEVSPDHYILNGTPADCVIMALRHVYNVFPNLIISGINHGANLGDDIMYSGTVAAAREASRYGVPSMAVSQAYDDKPIRFKEGAAYIRNLVEAMLREGLGGELCLNVNFPVRKIRGMKITRQGCAENVPHFNALDYRADYNAIPFSPGGKRQKSDFMSDRQAIMEHYVSITPLQRDQTDYTAVQSLLHESNKLFG
jgi:5'-nucleotidase